MSLALKRFKGPWRTWRLLGGIASAIVLVAFFQNCSKSGFGEVDSASISGVNQSLGAAPFPVEATFNQLSYMSCPAVAKNQIDPNDPLASPYYTLRFGGFSNDDLLSVKDGTVGGVGLTKSGREFVKNTMSATVTPQAVATYVRTSPYTNSKVLAAAVVLQSRTPQALTRPYPPLAGSLGETFSSTLFGTYIGKAGVDAEGNPQKVNYFSQLAYSKRSLLGSLNASGSSDVEALRTDLKTTNMLALGFVDLTYVGSPASIIQRLSSPDNDVTKRLYGRGYTMNFLDRGNTSNTYPAMTSVQELDLNPESGTGPTPVAGKAWTCLPPISIVRHIDRVFYYPTSTVTAGNLTISTSDAIPTGRLMASNGNVTGASINGAYFSVVEKTIKSPGEIPAKEKAMASKYQPYGIAVPWGIHQACPTQPAADLDTPQKRDKLKIIRRFLPADQWEVNLDLNCAVPTYKSVTSGHACYSSGDFNPTMYIQYDWATQGCGPGKAECPAFVSICYR